MKDENDMLLKEVLPKLDIDAISYIKNIEILQNFNKECNILQYINYKKNIMGIKIPLSYGVTAHPMCDIPDSPTKILTNKNTGDNFYSDKVPIKPISQ